MVRTARNARANGDLIRPVDLVPIERAVSGSQKLALVKGYLSMSASEAKDNAIWVNALRNAGWQGAIYLLRWESGATRDLIRSIGLSLLLRMGLKLAARRVLLPMPPLGLYELSEIRRHWSAVRQRAEAVDFGAVRGLLESEAPLDQWTLLGHSLGARIVFNFLARHDAADHAVGNAVLAGGTISRVDERWGHAAQGVTGALLNLYHPGDRVLNWLYRASEFNRISPCGVRPITCEHDRIRNVSAAPFLPKSFRSHMRYHETLRETVAPHLWTTPAPKALPMIAREEEEE